MGGLRCTASAGLDSVPSSMGALHALGSLRSLASASDVAERVMAERKRGSEALRIVTRLDEVMEID